VLTGVLGRLVALVCFCGVFPEYRAWFEVGHMVAVSTAPIAITATPSEAAAISRLRDRGAGGSSSSPVAPMGGCMLVRPVSGGIPGGTPGAPAAIVAAVFPKPDVVGA